MKFMRRAMLAAGALSAAVGAAVPLAPGMAQTTHVPDGVPSTSQPPNIIFVLVDDLRYDGMGFLQPRISTPNIDRLAREGTYFPDTLVTSSLCSPSRATILTGQTARNHGVVDNNNSTEEGLVFFPSYLQQAGYQTAFIGKWHMGDDTDAPRTGFDKWVSFRGQGSYFPSSSSSETTAADGPANMLNVDGDAVPQTGYITDELTDYAMAWLEQDRDEDRPFFLYLSHKAVHSDPLPPPRYAQQYDDVDFPLPASAANTPANYEGKPMWVYNQRNTWHGIDFFYNSDMTMPEYLRYYYATLSAVDDSLGRVLAYLEQHSLAENTLVVFTSDNGYLIGDHGLIDKRNAYEPSIRVPMLAWQPGTVPAGNVNQGRIRNLDFAPTFLGVAGLAPPPQFEGHNAWPLMNGSTPEGEWQPDDFIYEYYWEYNFPMTPGTFAIRRGDLKYIQYYGVYDLEELYDLSNDPEEMHNLIDDPDYLETKIELREALYEQLADRDGRHVIPYNMRRSRGSVRRDETGTGAAPFPDRWLVEPNREDRLDDILPDSLAKQRAHEEGRAFVPMPPLREAIEEQVRGH